MIGGITIMDTIMAIAIAIGLAVPWAALWQVRFGTARNQESGLDGR
jgi:hypothetical protein